MVQHLEGMTSTLLGMPTVTLIHTQTLETITLFQVEYKTGKQSWLGPAISHLMRWRCFILAETQDVTIEFYLVLDVSIALYNLCHKCQRRNFLKDRFGKYVWLG